MKKLVKFLLASLAFTGVAFANQKSAKLPDYDTKLAHELVNNKGALLLDVRTQAEYNQEHLPKAQRIEVSELANKIDEVKKLTKGKMDHPIVVYCRSGARSGSAKKILEKAGFTQVSNLGSYKNWYKK